VQEFFQCSVTNFQTLFTLRLSVLSSGPLASASVGPLAQLTEHLAKYVKIYRAVLAQNAKIFIELGSTVEIVQTVWHVIESAAGDVSKIDGGKLGPPGAGTNKPPFRRVLTRLRDAQRTCTRCILSGLWSSR